MSITRRKVAVFDLDSTIANTHHREHLAPAEDRHLLESWIAYSQACVDDGVIEGVAALARLLRSLGVAIVFASGRNEEAREQTIWWLDQNNIPWDEVKLHTADDPRHNAEHKVKYIRELQAAGYDVVLMLEDHIVVCEQIEAETGVPAITVRPRYEDGVGVSFNLNQYAGTDFKELATA